MKIYLHEKNGNPDLFTGRQRELDLFLDRIERSKRLIAPSE